MCSFHLKYHLLVLNLLCFTGQFAFANDANDTVSGSLESQNQPSPTVSASFGVCESRAVNYITYNPFASICFPHSSTSTESIEQTALSTPLPDVSINGFRTDTTVYATETAPKTTTQAPDTLFSAHPEPSQAETEAEALEDTAFLSFEDWKKKILEQETNTNRDTEKRKGPDRNRESLDAFEDDGEINIDFGAFLGNNHGDHASTDNKENTHQPSSNDAQADGGFESDDKQRYRSKDAGKTCKERTNFASMDLGAQLLKTNPEAKSASALLSENRDIYMLNDCRAKNKFLIVELSESILVETVALANFEFFSSTFREFRISVSDRYPVKLDRWIDIGTFEARNSRDLQAFLVADPRIWARYLRIEFLSHFGNEFYCPVSLLRVHGRTMIQDILSMDQPQGNDDEGVADEPINVLEAQGDAVALEDTAEASKEEETVQESLEDTQGVIEDIAKIAKEITMDTGKYSPNSNQILNANDILANVSTVHLVTAWNGSHTPDPFLLILQRADTCAVSEHPDQGSLTISVQRISTSDTAIATNKAANHTSTTRLSAVSNETEFEQKSSDIGDSNFRANTSVSSPELQSSSNVSSHEINSTTEATASVNNRQQGTSAGHVAPPTTQESFFKSVSKRLQLLESNSTLSLKYIEDQSKILREAFSRMEKRQLGKTTSFLENLNGTVLNELLRFGQQYDQMWQSTVIELENQRAEARREVSAVSARLNLLADELLFQKRMAIVQSVLLLLSLILVVFSRSLLSGVVDIPVVQNFLAKSHSVSDAAINAERLGRRSESSLYTERFPDDGHNGIRSANFHGSTISKSRNDSPSFSRPDAPLHGLEDEVPPRSLSASPEDVQDDYKDLNPYHHSEDSKSLSSSASDVILPFITQSSHSHGRNERFIEKLGPTLTIGEEKMGNPTKPKELAEASPHLPSPPPESRRHEFSIARKPLPALPQEHSPS